jgi:protein-L-isoaspartate(D-aspartate) O-methyltransferase
MVRRLVEQGIKNSKVLEVMKSTPRHIFLDEALAHRAYEDSALPIGHNQTLSQPYIVARMTELLVDSGPMNKVLEVGSGSGYQTAVLAQLSGQVYAVERIKALQDKARERLRLLKLNNVMLKHADGGFGWPQQGPFDAILSAAAPAKIPDELLQQLAPGGRLVIPVGEDRQYLTFVLRTDEGFESTVIEPVRFVPMRSGTVR